MNTLQLTLFALVSGYVVAQMFKLPYSECIYVGCVSAVVPLVLAKWMTKGKKQKDKIH